jgi:hypothetical protein
MRKTTFGMLAAIPVAATIVACGSGSSSNSNGPGAQDNGATAAASKAAKHTVILEVSGPKTADVTYGMEADQSQDNGTTLPWKKTLTADTLMLGASVYAQSKGTSGKITCKITVDGKVVKTNSSSGEYAVVTCQGGGL